MSNLSTQHLIKCIIQKDKYKHTQQYLKQVELDNQSAFNFINEALYNIITTSNYPPSAKLYALRFFKDLFISAQFHLIDGLHENIMKQIIKTSQFDKENTDKNKRGCSYFEQAQKRKKQPELQKVSYSYVLFSTEIVYVMGVWHALDQNNQTSEYFVIYDKLKKARVPFPENDKELKFFKPQEKELFRKNYKDWVQKLPEIEEESQEADNKENSNQKSKKSIRSKQKIPQPDEPRQNASSQIPLLAKDQNKTTQKSQSQTKRQDMQSSKVTKPFIDPSQFKRLQELNDSKEKQINQMQAKIDLLSKKNKDYQEKLSQLEVSLRAAKDSNSAQSKTEQEKLKIKLTGFQYKYSMLENKHIALEKEAHLLKSKLEETQSLREKQATQLQQQKNTLKKMHTEMTENEEKYKTTLQETKIELKEARQKIARLERKIEQLNTIKKSYKTIIEENHPEEKELLTKEKQQKTKIDELQKQIEETVQFYTKQTIQLKSQISELKSTNEELENLIKSKDKQIRSLNVQIQGKSNQISQLQANVQNLKLQTNRLTNQSYLAKQKQLSDQSQNQVQITVTVKREEPAPIQLNNIKPELKTQTQQRRENSMSDYLLSQANSPKHQPLPFQKARYQSQVDHCQTPLIEKVKNKSLGKTEKSEEKLRQKKQRFSAGKTFHFTNYDQRTIHESVDTNSNRLSQMNSAMKKAQSSSYGNLWKPVTRADPYMKFDHQQSFCKKTSALYLERKPYFLDYQTPKPNAIQTMVPYIENYFSQKSNMSHNDLTVFKSLCLSPLVRQKQPIFVDHNIQAKLLPNSSGSKQVFVLQVMNTGYSSIKVKAVSCHDEFKIVGEKLRFVHSNSTVEYRIQTRNKDLNLRYPIVSLIVTQDEGNRTKNIVYNVPLPLTLVEFTEMKKEIPDFYELQGSKLKSFKSETFSLNSRFESLRQLFPHLSFTQKGKQTRMQLRQVEVSWQGNLLHSFIQNVDTYFKMSQVGSQVTLEFAVRDYDIVSENYAKAMIQTLMFLLQ